MSSSAPARPAARLAHRLTEDAGVRVLVLEAGGWDSDPLIGIPILWGRNALQRRHDWNYSTEPEATLAGQRLPIYRGKVIGGSSSINAMAYVRGHRGDYDRWAGVGLPHWSYAHALPYFRRQETWQGGADRLSRRRRAAHHLHAATSPIRSATPSSRRALRRGCPRRRTTTARSRKGSAARNRPSATASGAARRSPICARRSRAPTSRSRPARSSQRS